MFSIKHTTLLTSMIYFQWDDEPNTAYKELYKKFVRTPVIWNGKKVDTEATYDDPTQLFPDSYVEYIGIQYGKEKDTTASMIYYEQKQNFESLMF